MMTKSKQQLIDNCVEALCQKGCSAVWSDIEALEAGQPLPETHGLDTPEREAVLHELKAVMSIYRGTCSVA
jgi:6-phosphogluconate dehydrogenase